MFWHVAMHQQACIPVLVEQPVPLESKAAWDPLLESTLSTAASSACSKVQHKELANLIKVAITSTDSWQAL